MQEEQEQERKKREMSKDVQSEKSQQSHKNLKKNKPWRKAESKEREDAKKPSYEIEDGTLQKLYDIIVAPPKGIEEKVRVNNKVLKVWENLRPFNLPKLI